MTANLVRITTLSSDPVRYFYYISDKVQVEGSTPSGSSISATTCQCAFLLHIVGANKKDKAMEGKSVDLMLNINPVFLQEDPDGRECECCKGAIFSKMYRLWVMPEIDGTGITLPGRDLDICLCESCYEICKDEIV